jgi:adenylylsulfate kinase
MVRPDEPPTADDPARQRQVLLGQAGRVAWFTGLPSAGKSTIAAAAERELLRQGRLTRILDGDAMRGGLCRDLRYSLADRTENLRRLAEMAALFAETGVITLVAAISPLRAHRAAARAIVGPDRFLEVYVRADVATCERRDPKGNYARARAGLLGVIGTGRIARRGADAAVLFLDQLFVAESLRLSKAPGDAGPRCRYSAKASAKRSASAFTRMAL